jgi:acetyl-CoA acetyltransferase
VVSLLFGCEYLPPKAIGRVVASFRGPRDELAGIVAFGCARVTRLCQTKTGGPGRGMAEFRFHGAWHRHLADPMSQSASEIMRSVQERRAQLQRISLRRHNNAERHPGPTLRGR